jgi:ABC-2 type transport system ATP-binding protein
MTNSPIIDLQNVSKQYILRNWKSLLYRTPQKVQAIQGVSLQVQEGEIMGLLGPNGAGKTTLLKILATLITPDKGSAFIAGLDCNTNSLAVRKQIGYVNTNDRSFYWRLTGKENLQFFGHLYDLSANALEKRIDEVISLTGLEQKKMQRFGTYSSGERQRLSIARAMLADPQILLMDEATANLDPIVSAELIRFTRETLAQKQRKTIIWCTHNLVEAEALCDRVTILYGGRVISCTSIDELRQHVSPLKKYRLILDRLPPLLTNRNDFIVKEHSKYKGCNILIKDEAVPDLIRDLNARDVQIYECAKIEQPFEEIFINLINSRSASNRVQGRHK